MDEKTTYNGERETDIPIIPPSEIKALEEQELAEKREAETSNSTEESVIYWRHTDHVPAKLSDLKKCLRKLSVLEFRLMWYSVK